MSDPFVMDNPWTLRRVALLWAASAAGPLVEGKIDGEKKGPLSFRVEPMRSGSHGSDDG